MLTMEQWLLRKKIRRQVLKEKRRAREEGKKKRKAVRQPVTQLGRIGTKATSSFDTYSMLCSSSSPQQVSSPGGNEFGCFPCNTPWSQTRPLWIGTGFANSPYQSTLAQKYFKQEFLAISLHIICCVPVLSAVEGGKECANLLHLLPLPQHLLRSP